MIYQNILLIILKKGFSVPIINWLKNKELQNLFIHIIYQDKILLTESYKRHLKFKILNLDNYQNAFKIWNIVCLCRWTQINKFKFYKKWTSQIFRNL